MRKRLMKLTLLGVFVIGCASATEIRSPWISERGPLRYKFEKGNPDRYSLDVYSTGYLRQAHKSFLSHGIDTHPLTALLFNKADFKVSESFPNKFQLITAENYNPFLSLVKISPRATYYEWGMNLGGRFEYPVYKDKGRIGLRANIPFRCIEIERENITDKTSDPTEDLILSKMVRLETSDNSANDALAAGGIVERQVKAYNLAFVSNLYDEASRTPAVVFADKKVQVFGTEIQVANDSFAKDKKMATDIKKPVGIIYNAAGQDQPQAPGSLDGTATDGAGKYRWAFNFTDDQARNFAGVNIAADGTGNPAKDNYAKGVAWFADNVNYSPFAYNVRKDAQNDQLENMWIVLGYTNGNLTGAAKNVSDGVAHAIERFQEDPYEWLWLEGGYQFETERRSNFGDIDLDLFYEHMFSERWIGELFLGVRFPTGVDDNYCYNPYQVHTGNGEHWEIRFGGLLAWQPLRCMNIKLDLIGAYAFEGTEHRCAAFEGAAIKNMGPCVNADVDWWYFIGRLDFNFFHPKTKDISGLVGYEFYYKGEDDLHFKQSTAVPWYGNNVDGTSNAANLSNKVAETNTEEISHKVRFEGRYQFCEWLEGFAGGTYTFAGQNILREGDAHAGVNVRF